MKQDRKHLRILDNNNNDLIAKVHFNSNKAGMDLFVEYVNYCADWCSSNGKDFYTDIFWEIQA